jgi:excisionase family DNA binding protein
MVSYVLEDSELQQRIKSALRVLAVGDTWLTPTEAATRARISKSHFLRLLRAAKGPKHSGEGRLMRFRVSDVDAWIDSGFREPERGYGGPAQSTDNACRSKEPVRAARQLT